MLYIVNYVTAQVLEKWYCLRLLRQQLKREKKLQNIGHELTTRFFTIVVRTRSDTFLRVLRKTVFFTIPEHQGNKRCKKTKSFIQQSVIRFYSVLYVYWPRVI